MKILLGGIIFFILPFITQIFFWRRRIIARKPVNIVKIFLIFYLLTLMIFILINYFSPSSISIIAIHLLELLYIYLISISIFIAYILTYSGIESDSPSGLILLEIEKSDSKRLSRTELYGILNNENTVLERLNGLIRDNKVQLINDKYVLTKNGKTLLKIILLLKSFFLSGEIDG